MSLPRSGVKQAWLTLPDKPSIAVLPFTNLGANPDNDYFSDGLTDEITEGLARLNHCA